MNSPTQKRIFVNYRHYYLARGSIKNKSNLGYIRKMVRGKNNCGWLMLSRKETCGKRCMGEYCAWHNYQLKTVKKRPVPCRSCGAGVVCDYRLCLACGGSKLKHRLIRKHRKAKKNFERVLVELKHKQLEK